MKSVLGAPLPRRATIGSAGYDIIAPTSLEVEAGKRYLYDTGIRFTQYDIPTTWVALLFPRSSLGFKYGMRFANTIGVVDSDYRDNILIDFTADAPFRIEKGDKIAQMIFIEYETLWGEVKPTKVRDGGIGSTGH